MVSRTGGAGVERLLKNEFRENRPRRGTIGAMWVIFAFWGKMTQESGVVHPGRPREKQAGAIQKSLNLTGQVKKAV